MKTVNDRYIADNGPTGCALCDGSRGFAQEGLNRRGFLRIGMGSLLGLFVAQWSNELWAATEGKNAKAKACILLWMNGGPSQLDTLDPKPNTANGGPTKTVKTAIEGVEFSENLTQLAEQAKRLAVIRSMTSREGNHQRAQYLLHTGYVPQGTVQYPSLGAWVSEEVGDAKFDLPNFVSINGSSFGAGFLGVAHSPFVVRDPRKPVDNLSLPTGVDGDRFAKRLKVLNFLEGELTQVTQDPLIKSRDDIYTKAIKMMNSPLVKAFDVSQEPAAMRQAYGDNSFGQGCLMARRLVESGVKFVEVVKDGWDTHTDNFTRVPTLLKEVDPAFATLLNDLSQRDLLKSTLVIWMGEFGRTPKINGRDGRDHYPQAWSCALAGGGIRGGQVIGATSPDGMQVADHPITVPDLFASLCALLGIDPRKTVYTPQGRPITIADKGGKVVEELLA